MTRNFVPGQHNRFEELVNLSKVLNSIFLASLVAIGMVAINVIRGSVNYATLSVVGLFLVTAGFYWVYSKGYLTFAGVGMIVSISVVVTINVMGYGGIHDNAIMVFPLLIMVAGLVLGKRFIPYLTGIFLLEISVLYWSTVVGWITPFEGVITVHLQSFLTVFILLLISGMMIWITANNLERNFRRIIDSEIALRESYDQTIGCWGKALELIDRKTEGHSQRVIDLTLKLAEELNVEASALEHYKRGAMLHDIGKMSVDEGLLNKPESLSDEEKRQIEQHPLNALKLLKDIPFLERAMDIPLYHHENWDGTGYPFRLAGEEIPLAARVFAIVDNWDALRSDRSYRKAWPKDKVVQYLENQSGRKFDPEVVDVFLELIR